MTVKCKVSAGQVQCGVAHLVATAMRLTAKGVVCARQPKAEAPHQVEPLQTGA